MARPSLIIGKTVIGYGSPNKADTAAAHGEPLGAEEVKLTRQKLNWPYAEPFTVPPEVLDHMRLDAAAAANCRRSGKTDFKQYGLAYPRDAERFLADLRGELPTGWADGLDGLFPDRTKPIATRDASGKIMNMLAGKVHSFMGGSADLAPSTKTYLMNLGDYGPENYSGRNMHFGVREHSMGTIVNGMALHGGIIPYAGTFLIFYDYMRTPVRLAALMGIRVIYIFTHDSIGLGQDGPTHQPVEQLTGLRAVPGLVTIRPADGTETVEAWKLALERRNGPTALVLTRQNLPILDRSILSAASGVRKGGYVLREPDGQPRVVLIGTGSEVHIALEAAKILGQKGINSRVVSMPSWEIFDAQPVDYRDNVLPPQLRVRVSIEAASPLGWERYVGTEGIAIGVSCFGASAPGEIIYQKMGLTAQNVADEATRILPGR